MKSSHERNKNTSERWLTPRWLLETIGPFDLDPCADQSDPQRCAPRYFTKEADGLLCDWKGTVFCNPPYGRDVGAWLKKCAAHGNGIMLVFARTDTAAFIDHVFMRADAIAFLHGRLRFQRPDGSIAGNAGAPSCLVAYNLLSVIRLQDAIKSGRLNASLVHLPSGRFQRMAGLTLMMT